MYQHVCHGKTKMIYHSPVLTLSTELRMSHKLFTVYQDLSLHKEITAGKKASDIVWENLTSSHMGFCLLLMQSFDYLGI